MNQNHIIEAFDEIIDNYCLPEKYKSFILNEIKVSLDVFYTDLKNKKNSLEFNLKELNNRSERLFNLVVK